MKRIVFLGIDAGTAAVIATAVVIVALAFFPPHQRIPKPTPAPAPRPPAAVLSEEANEVIRNMIRANGQIPGRLVIVSERIDGDRATVIEDARWSSTINGPTTGAEVTLLFDRTVWSVVGSSAGAIPAS